MSLDALLDVPQHPLSLGAPGAAEATFVDVPGGQVRVLRRSGPGRPVVLLPGFGAPILPWDDCHRRVMDHADYVVVETLEKSSGPLTDPAQADLSIAGLARQVGVALDWLGLSGAPIIGSCHGGAVLLEGLRMGVLTPDVAVAFDPMDRLYVPRWLTEWVGPRLPAGLLGALRGPVGALMLRRMQEPHQKARVKAFIDAADPVRWKKAAQQTARFELRGRLGGIEREVLVFAGSTDDIHKPDVARAIADELPQGRFFHVPVDETRREALVAAITRVLGTGDVTQTFAGWES